MLLGDLLSQNEVLFSQHAVVGQHVAGAFDLEVQQLVLTVEAVFDCLHAGEGVSGADELAVPVLGEDEEVRVATWDDGRGVIDVGLFRRGVSAKSDQSMSVELTW